MNARLIRNAALGLPPRTRAKLGRALLDSVDPLDDGLTDAEALGEAERRLAAIRSGDLGTVSWTKVKAMLKKKIARNARSR